MAKSTYPGMYETLDSAYTVVMETVMYRQSPIQFPEDHGDSACILVYNLFQRAFWIYPAAKGRAFFDIFAVNIVF